MTRKTHPFSKGRLQFDDNLIVRSTRLQTQPAHQSKLQWKGKKHGYKSAPLNSLSDHQARGKSANWRHASTVHKQRAEQWAREYVRNDRTAKTNMNGRERGEERRRSFHEKRWSVWREWTGGNSQDREGCAKSRSLDDGRRLESRRIQNSRRLHAWESKEDKLQVWISSESAIVSWEGSCSLWRGFRRREPSESLVQA